VAEREAITSDIAVETIEVSASARVEVIKKETPIAAKVVSEVASITQLITINVNETAMHENLTDSWKSLAGDSRRIEGFARQTVSRTAEAVMRDRAAELGDALHDDGCCVHQISRRMHVPQRTLSRWRCCRRHPQLVLPRGRPCKESTPIERCEVLELLEKEGRHLGLPTLRAEFPRMPRCELHDLQAGYRRHYRAIHRRLIERLTWHGSGRVWAMDHVDPPTPIDDGNRAVLAVRDLASGMQLAWQPVLNQTEPPATAALESLFEKYGPPLVLKSDNGSAFKSNVLQAMLVRYGVIWLPSPPRMPQYNGSCEAGNGSLRRRTDHFARRAGRWTSSCLRAARRQANELTRPRGRHALTHSERWAVRKPIDPTLREQFAAAVERHRQAILDECKDTLNPQNRNQQNQVQRQAVRRALLELGLLTTNRRSIPPPIKRKKSAIFS
jgi:transposase InsO family protein